jgi:hypothetical protein
MFKIGDRVRLISNHILKGQCGTVTGFEDEFVKTTIGSGGGWYPSSLELIESGGSVRCEICSGCDHLTVECPGLCHNIEPVFKERMNGFISPEQQAAFDARMVAAGQAKPCECDRCDTANAAEPTCSRCGEQSHAGRVLFPVNEDLLVCGDCMSGGTPLIAQPIKETERIKYHAGMTPTWDWVGDL